MWTVCGRAMQREKHGITESLEPSSSVLIGHNDVITLSGLMRAEKTAPFLCCISVRRKTAARQLRADAMIARDKASTGSQRS